MNKLLSITLGVAGAAGSLCGVPYLGIMVSIVNEIQNACQQVVLHKVNLICSAPFRETYTIMIRNTV